MSSRSEAQEPSPEAMDAMRDLRWLMPRDVYSYYLSHTLTEDGISFASILDNLHDRLDIEIFNWRTLEDAIRRAEHVVFENMITKAEDGEWIAFGRRHPETDEEVIPQRYWPFLTLDIENRFAWNRRIGFRGIRGLIARQIPKGHPIVEKIRIAQIIPNRGSAPAIKPVPAPSPHPVAAKTGAPGRPSSMHYIRAEFERRAKAGTLEKSLRMEAELLVAWIKSSHPSEPPPTAKTVRNNLSADYRAAKKPD